MYRKAKKINVILVISVFVLSSCRQSYFQMLTNNDVGYWRTEKWIEPICGYSKQDSTFSNYHDNMVKDHDYHRIWFERSKHEFRISSDTLYHYHIDKLMGEYHHSHTYKIISFKRNRLRLVYIPTEWERCYSDYSNPDTITWIRVKNRDIKRLRKGKKVTYKDCKDGGIRLWLNSLTNSLTGMTESSRANILKRNEDWEYSGRFIAIDNLTLGYRGNRLLKVTDKGDACTATGATDLHGAKQQTIILVHKRHTPQDNWKT